MVGPSLGYLLCPYAVACLAPQLSPRVHSFCSQSLARQSTAQPPTCCTDYGRMHSLSASKCTPSQMLLMVTGEAASPYLPLAWRHQMLTCLVKHRLPCDSYTVTQEGPDPSQG